MPNSAPMLSDIASSPPVAASKLNAVVRSQSSDIALSAGNPVILGQLDYEIDYNLAAKTFVATALGFVPYAGFALGPMVQVFWPSTKTDVWAEIEKRVEALIDRKIAERVWQQTADAVAGLRNVLEDYLRAVEKLKNDPDVVSQKWNVANGLFLRDLPAFQSTGFELLLLPLFAQFANLHLMLLRDGAKFGANWGWSPELVADVTEQIAERIPAYLAYSDEIYQAGLRDVIVRTKGNRKRTEPFNSVNRFRREMTLLVLDFSLAWPFFDLIAYPDPVDLVVKREIYSDVVGTADDTGVTLPRTPPTQPIGRIKVWGADRIDAVQVDYPINGGPDGRTSTGRQGNQKGGTDQPPLGGIFETQKTGAIVRVKASSGDIVNAMWLTFVNGSTTHMLGGAFPGGRLSVWEYPGEELSSIKVMGVSRFYGSANAAVFGFKFRGERFPTGPDAAMARAFYVGDPAAGSAAELAEALGYDSVGREQLEFWVEDYGWDILRGIYGSEREQRLQAFEGLNPALVP